MKKHFILTSLVAIAMSCPAMAATDVKFSGDFTLANGETANVADSLAGTTYEYVKSDGTTASGVAYDSDPVKTDFTYTNGNGETKSLQDGIPDISTYTGETTASGDVVSTQTIAAGATASRENYTYKNGAGEVVTLGETAQDMVETHTLSEDYAGGAVATITNGASDIAVDGSMYSFEFEGQTFKLSTDGTAYTLNGVPQEEPTEASSKALFDLLTDVRYDYNTDKAAIEAAKTTTADNKALEDINFDAANKVFNDDTARIAELDKWYASVGDATDKYNAAIANQQSAKDAYAANEAELNAAKGVYYNQPILETITNGANDAIDNALAENGAIDVALDSMRDEAKDIFAEKQQWVDNTLGIESAKSDAVSDALTGEIAGNETTFSGAINAIDGAVSKNTADIATNAENIALNKTAIETNATNIATNAENIALNKTAIETNATNIAANKTAIEAEVARATAAEVELDGKIALNTAAIEEEVANRIAGDEMTLASAKAYVDSKNELALKSAYDYTDSKVNALEEDLSAGIASAAAMSSVAVSGVGRGEVSVGGGYGHYNSQSAVAFGAAMGLTDNWSVNAAAGLADSNVTFRAGTNYKFKLF